MSKLSRPVVAVWFYAALWVSLVSCAGEDAGGGVEACVRDCHFPPLPVLTEQSAAPGEASSGPKVYAQSDGIEIYPASDHTTASLGKKLCLDDFEDYPEKAVEDELAETYTMNSGGDQVTLSLSRETKEAGDFSLRYAYDLELADYCGVYRGLEADWSGAQGILFWLKPDGSQRTLTVQFRTRGASGSVYWELYLTLAGTEPVIVRLPLSAFHYPPWYTPNPDEAAIAVAPEVSQVEEFSLYINQSVGTKGESVLYFDSIGLY